MANLFQLCNYFVIWYAYVVFIALVHIVDLNYRLEIINIVFHDIRLHSNFDETLILEVFNLVLGVVLNLSGFFTAFKLGVLVSVLSDNKAVG